MLYEPGMSCRQYVCFNLVHCVMFCWQINNDDDDDDISLFHKLMVSCKILRF